MQHYVKRMGERKIVEKENGSEVIEGSHSMNENTILFKLQL